MKGQYAPYLILNDYLTTIRGDQFINQLLDEVAQGGEMERLAAESYAISEVYSKLGAYFYLDFEFRDIKPFYYNRKYHAGDRCIIDFPLWVAGTGSESEIESPISYNIGDCILYNGGTGYSGGKYIGNFNDGSVWVGYSCSQPTSSSVWKSSEWIAIGNWYDIYNVPFPYSIFQLMPSPQIGIETPGIYIQGEDNVCWANRIYSCIASSIGLNHQQQEQFYEIQNIPAPNVFPNQKMSSAIGFQSGSSQWMDQGEFYFKGVLPFQTNWNDPSLNEGVDAWTSQYRPQWNIGDNRDPIMKEIIVALSLSKLEIRNSFMLKERAIERDRAYRKLELIKKGEDTTLIPIIQPEQAGNISFGGDVKKINQW